ncbi:MAG: hypothetical protein GWN71_31375, partial [Gammaproteobacteria bacterium]|nr:hypothetical protein [Gemmatimonadota bacterium]NIU77893.1 hypothetical protein [Gammaproteobacteria bacterium]NIY11361.1 hypothetical protein [Gemmatimonadota bacterium]
PGGVEAEIRGLERETGELSGRARSLYGSAQDWVGPLTSDQASQRTFLTEMLVTLEGEWAVLEGRLPG